MLKRIPKSDISIRPFKVYKEWDKTSAGVTLIDAEEGNYASTSATTITDGILSGSSFVKHSVYGQLRAQFYNGNEDNPFYRLGSKTNTYDETNPERFLSGSAKVISIPQMSVGDGIKKGSVTLSDNGLTYIDDGFSNLILSGSTHRIGNVFYNQGLVVVTSGSNNVITGNDWQLSFKSTETIYEHEYLLVVNEDEFNFSQNPSSYVLVGRETSSFTDSDNRVHTVVNNPGVKYIRKKTITEKGDVVDYRFGSAVNNSISGGFEHWDLSGSIDSTGSFLAPFITTIGLYDDNCDLLAVAKLPQPIKSDPELPVNFIVRFDT